jgi:hypothetical protein
MKADVIADARASPAAAPSRRPAYRRDLRDHPVQALLDPGALPLEPGKVPAATIQQAFELRKR